MKVGLNKIGSSAMEEKGKLWLPEAHQQWLWLSSEVVDAISDLAAEGDAGR